MPGSNFHYVGRELILLQDGSYCWIDIKRFWLPTQLTDPLTGLQLLLGHTRYRDDYLAASSHETDAIDRHGPYRLDQISPRSFDPIDEATAVGAMRAFVADDSDVLAEDVRRDVDFRVYRQIRRMPIRYRLPDLGKHAFHDFGWILDEFTELILMDPSTSELLLLVASGD